MSELLYDVDLIFGYEPLSLPDGSGNDEKDGLDRVADIEEIKPFLAKIHQTYDISYIAFTQRKFLTIKETAYKDFYLHQINSHKLKKSMSIFLIDWVQEMHLVSVSFMEL